MDAQDAPVVTARETIQAMLERSKRESVPVRRSFLARLAPDRRPPLAMIVQHRDERALDLYLLFLAQASGGDFDVSYPAAVWARALGLDSTHAPVAVSKTLARLVGYNLVTRDRRGRHAHVTLLREDGSGAPYTPPYQTKEAYLRIPHAYWTEGWHDRLSLPEKVALLVSLAFPPEFFLSIESAPKQFAISADTLGQGVRELRNRELLGHRAITERDPLVASGYRTEHRYWLLRSFARAKERRDPTLPSLPRLDDPA